MRGLIGAYRDVLANRDLARLFAGFLIGSLADWVSAIALIILAWETTDGDPLIVGLVGAIRIVPYLVLGIPAGYAADRYDRRRILLVCGSARILAMAAIALLAAGGAGAPVVVLAAMAATTISVFFQPAIGALLPGLCRDEGQLGPANAVYASLDILAVLGGAAAAAILLALVPSVPFAFALNGAVFALAVLILRGLPPQGRPPGTAAVASVRGSAAAPRPAAVVDPRATRPIVALLVFELIHSFVVGGLVVITAYLAFDIVRGGEVGTAALNTALGAGGAAGVVIGGILVLRRRVEPPFLTGVVLIGAGLLALAAVATLPALMVALFAIALGSLITSIVGGTVYQRMVPDGARGRMVATLDTIWEVVYALGAFSVPSLIVIVGFGPLVLGCALALAVTGLTFVAVLGPWRRQPEEDAPIRAHLSRVAALSALAPGRLARAERRAEIVTVAEGEAIIRQGDPADRFYAIAAGEVEVTQVAAPGESPRLLRRMGVDEGFGEIGILAGSPRTVTVTAATDVVLVALVAADFLELVGVGEPSGPSAVALAFPWHR